MATHAQPPSHDPVGMGLVGAASIVLAWSLRLIGKAFRSVRGLGAEREPHWLKRVLEGQNELRELFANHEEATTRIENALKSHTEVTFPALERRLVALEATFDEFRRDQRKQNRDVNESLQRRERRRGQS